MSLLHLSQAQVCGSGVRLSSQCHPGLSGQAEPSLDQTCMFPYQPFPIFIAVMMVWGPGEATQQLHIQALEGLER